MEFASDSRDRAPEVIEAGLRECAGLGHPLVRERHYDAWAHRLSALDPEAATDLLPRLPADPSTRADLLRTVIADRLRVGATDPEPQLSQVLELVRNMPPDDGMRLVNGLSELGMELGDRDHEAGIALLQRLIEPARSLTVPDVEPQQPRAVAVALVGEALATLNDPRAAALLHEALELIAALPARDPILAFIADSLAQLDPNQAVEVVDEIADEESRAEARLRLAGKLPEGEARERLVKRVLFGTLEETLHEERPAPARAPEHWLRVAQVMAEIDRERALWAIHHAIEAAREVGPQLRSLHWAAAASALAAIDREGAASLYAAAADAVLAEEETVRRVTTLAVVADQMAESFPREAASVFARALAEAGSLDALWELAHLIDIVFRPDRSPYLDVSVAGSLLDRVVERLSEDDPRIPGVLGLPDVARVMLDVDREKAAVLFHRWFDAAERAGDTDGMTGAALGLLQADPEAGRRGLERVRDYLLERIDCPSMGEFSRQTARVAPDLVLELADRIPDRRERADATAAAAVHVYPRDPRRGLELIASLERPVDRSLALLQIADTLLGTSDRPQPQPLLEEMP